MAGASTFQYSTNVIRIVIADDHEIVREGLRAILQPEPDFEVVADSASAADLDRLVDEVRPDVVLLDAGPPGARGAEVCRRLVASDPDAAVLIVSSHSDDELVDECIKAGAKGYVMKDIDSGTLKDCIRAVHRGEGAVSPAIAAKVLDRLRTNRRETADGSSSRLTDAQLGILRLVAAGHTNREIAARVFVSESTVKSHVQEIFRRLDVRNRVEAALLASRKGWL